MPFFIFFRTNNNCEKYIDRTALNPADQRAGQANITWAIPTTDDALGDFDKFEVEIAQVSTTGANTGFKIKRPNDLPWKSVYIGPDATVSVVKDM